jgi:hypothetical protein
LRVDFRHRVPPLGAIRARKPSRNFTANGPLKAKLSTARQARGVGPMGSPNPRRRLTSTVKKVFNFRFLAEFRGVKNEAHLSTFRRAAQAHPWFSGSHEDQGWAQCDPCAARQGPPSSRRLRATRLAAGNRRRRSCRRRDFAGSTALPYPGNLKTVLRVAQSCAASSLRSIS